MNESATVLMVDDRPENLIALEAVLVQLEIPIHKASSAEEALRFLSDHEVALILLDVEMPGIDGIEAARLIRERPRLRNTPIIFVTAFDTDRSRIREGYRLGAVDYIIKPFEPDVLRWKVSVFIELYRSRQQERLLAEEHVNRVDAEAAVRQARLLADAGAALASSMEEDRVIERVAALLVPEFADCTAIFRPASTDDSRLCRTALFPKDSAFADTPVFECGDGPVAKAFQHGNLETMERFSHSDSPLKSGLFLPLRGSHTVLGVLALYRRDAIAFNASDRLFVAELAERITLTMMNLALYRVSEEANRAKDRFLARVSHELRTPLTAVMGWTEILLSKQMPPDAMENALRTIQRNARLQQKLLEDILDFSGIAIRKLSIDLQEVEIGEVATQSIDAMRPLADGKGVRLIAEIRESAMVAGDPVRLQQVVTNLLSNAIKFTPKDGTVTMTLEHTADAVSIKVKDTGMGIAPDFLPYVFEPFVQAESGAAQHSGLGLGLAIVRQLAELHKGTVHVESAGPGQGATFVLTLPIKDARDQDKVNVRGI
jgi:signal transduction histidine kinase/DNA-binding response OmpR family regulator